MTAPHRERWHPSKGGRPPRVIRDRARRFEPLTAGELLLVGVALALILSGLILGAGALDGLAGAPS